MFDSEQGSIGPDEFREVMRRVPSPVTVVTFASGREIYGVTIGSFVSLSLTPALVSFNLQHSASTHAAFAGVARFAIHILSSQQAELSERFASPDLRGRAQFEGVDYDVDEAGIPVLRGVVATLFCVRQTVHTGGDHDIIVGRVERSIEGASNEGPLLFYMRDYHTVDG